MYRQTLCCFILMCLARDAALRENESCYADNSHPYIYTSTKTAYQYVNNNVTERITLPNCRPVYTWLYSRHGTRYPGRDIMAQMLNLTYMRDHIVDNHETHKRGHLCDKDIQNLKNWSPEPGLMAQFHKYLTSQGEKDMSGLGERVRTRFPELFDVNKPSSALQFRSTNTQRTIASMASFISGAFGPDFAANMEIDRPMTESVMLEIYKNCQPWLDEMNGTRANRQVQEFIDGPEVAKVVADVNRRLGFASNISKDDVFLLYDTCRFEKAWHPGSLSPWCAAFTDNEMRVIEYEEDLFFYYYASYGLEINKKLGCHNVQDMFDRFAKLEHAQDATGELKGTFSFSHSVGIMLFLTSMDIGKDTTPLTSRNYQDMAHRNWRTSLLLPFAANFMGVFHRCNSEVSPFKIVFYLAEKPLFLEGCENEVCDWAKLKEKLSPIASNCDAKFC